MTLRPCETTHTMDSESWLGVLSHSLLSGRFWNEKLLQDVCAGLVEELPLSPDAPGGMIEFRRTLTLSFFFKFYLTVLQKLGKEDSEDVSLGPGQGKDFLQHLCLGIWEAGGVGECRGPGGKRSSPLDV